MRTQWDWQWCLELKPCLSYQALAEHQDGLYSTYRKDAHTVESLGVGDVGVPSNDTLNWDILKGRI